MQYLTYLLAVNPDKQDKLYDEIVTAIGDVSQRVCVCVCVCVCVKEREREESERETREREREKRERERERFLSQNTNTMLVLLLWPIYSLTTVVYIPRQETG